jgi:uncharacterized delta-60 repeat protein
MKQILLVTLLVLGGVSASFAQFDGTIDSTFAENGVFLYNMGGDQKDDLVEKAVFGPDGKMYIAGYTSNPNRNIFLVRLLADGSLDNSFGNAGTVEFDPSIGGDDILSDMVVMENGKIVIAGYVDVGQADQLVARFNSDGTLDQSFNQTGIRLTGGPNWDIWRTCWVDENGRILLGGYTSNQEGQNLALMRLLPDGSNDTEFGFGGVNVFDFADSEVFSKFYMHASDRIYALATIDNKDYLCALDGEGELLYDFGNNGRVNLNIYGSDWEVFTDVRTDESGAIFLTGTVADPDFETDVLIVKTQSDGTLSQDFGVGGIFRAALGGGEEILATEMSFLPDGNLFFAGSFLKGNDRNLISFQVTSNGLLNASYGTNGVMEYPVPNNADEFAVGIAEDAQGNVHIYGVSDQASGYEVTVLKLKSNLSPSSVREELVPAIDVDVFPNPTSEALWLTFQTAFTQDVQISMANANGQLVAQLPSRTFATGSHQVDASTLLNGLTPGWYLVLLQMEEGVVAEKVFKH